VSRRPADDDPSLIRPALAGLVPYEPGKPVEEVQRELGLERVVKLASNEGPYGPFPAAQEAIARAALELNRYPDGGSYRLREALAARHGVRFEEVTVCAGADAVIGFTVLATLDPGDEAVTGWPSFPSYALDPLKVGAVPVRVPLREERFDLEAMLDAVTARTKLVFIAAPNNPTGTTSTRDELDAYFARVPEHVLTVVDQAYFEYVDDPAYPDAIEEYAKAGRRVLVLRTFSKIYGLAGLRVGYGVGPLEVVTAIAKVRRAFDVTSAGQEAALASLDDAAEVGRRRAANREARALLEGALRRHGLEPVGPAVANFVFVRVGDADALHDALLRKGVIVRPLGAFGAPDALRITAGTPDEIAFLSEALSALAPALRT
jgi:histidinol-phosphate aminotransferase